MMDRMRYHMLEAKHAKTEEEKRQAIRRATRAYHDLNDYDTILDEEDYE